MRSSLRGPWILFYRPGLYRVLTHYGPANNISKWPPQPKLQTTEQSGEGCCPILWDLKGVMICCTNPSLWVETGSASSPAGP